MPEDKKEEGKEEDDEEPQEQVEFLGKAPKRKETRVSYFHPPLPKPTKKFDPEDKKENELLRQFRVKISNVEIVNETKEVIDPFIRFIIGGSYFIEIKKKGGDETVYLPQGELGIIHMTDVAKFLEGNQSRIFEREINTVYTASYFKLESERLHIEIWDSEGFFLNQFMSYNTIPLIDIVDGPMQHTVQCFPYIEDFKPGKLNGTVNLKMNLAEIWDFHIEFMDWKTTIIQDMDKKDKSINPYITIMMDDPQVLESFVKSPELQNTFLPYWAKIDKGIIFRGTYHELKS